MIIAQERHALYYPYIHVRDANWLKATLLNFPQVRCMVPEGGLRSDVPEVAAFRKLTNAHGEPLLTSEDPKAAGDAQSWLLEQFKKYEPILRMRYSRSMTEQEYPADPNQFQIHGGKFLKSLWDFMQSDGRDLAWPVRETTVQGLPWYAVHPKLGEAMMSVLAISIAHQKGLEVVTGTPKVHHTVVTQNKEGIFNNLILDHSVADSAPPITDVADNIASIALINWFDYSRITSEEIAELIKEGKDLRSFKEQVMVLAQQLPAIPDPEERAKRMKHQADQIIHDWQEYKQKLPTFARDAFFDKFSVEDVVSGVRAAVMTVGAIAAGAAALPVVATTVGLTICVLLWNGWGAKRSYEEMKENPYQFLSKLEKAGATLVTPPVGAVLAPLSS